MPIDVEKTRKSYADVLANQQLDALKNVQGLYAGRGTTGSGAEAYAVGQTGREYGLGAAQNELALQQALGQQEQFGQQLGQQQSQFGQTLGEQQRQFNAGQGNWQQQFGANQQQQQFGNQMSLLPLIYKGMLNQGSAFGGGATGGQNPFGQITTEQQQQENSPSYQALVQAGFKDPTMFGLFNSLGGDAYESLFGKLKGPTKKYQGGFIGGGA